jgi:hypothetical protein
MVCPTSDTEALLLPARERCTGVLGLVLDLRRLKMIIE